MNSLHKAIERAEEMGWNKAALGSPALDRTNGHQIVYPMGVLALDVYREYGEIGLKNIGQAYQAGYNARARRLGVPSLDHAEIKNRIGAVLPPSATAEERAAIPEAI